MDVRPAEDAGAAAGEPDEPGSRRFVPIVVVAALLLGLVLRLWILGSPLRPFDADESVVGLMGRHLFAGSFRSFYWGQPYGGAQEAFLVGLLMAVRVPAWVAMEVVPIGLSAAAAALIWRIGRRTVGSTGAALGAALFWTTSGTYVWASTKLRGFYGSTMVAGLAVILLVLRLIERPSRRDALLLGVAGGAGWYASPQIVYLVVPALLWLGLHVVRRRDVALLRVAPLAALGAVVAAVPWIYTNLRTGGASLRVAESVPDTTYLHRLGLFAKRGFPYALGVEQNGHFLSGWDKLLYVALLVALGLALLRLPRKAYVIAIGLVLYPLIFAAFPTSWYVDEPRYLYFIWPFVVLVVGCAVARFRSRVLGLVVLVAIAASTVFNVALMVDRGRSDYGLWDFAPGDVTPLVSRLRADGTDRVFADYWIAYRIGLATEERVIASPLQTIRYQPYERAVRANPLPAYVFFAGSEDERRLFSFLEDRGIPHTRTPVGIYSIVRPDRRVMPEEVVADWAVERCPQPSGAC